MRFNDVTKNLSKALKDRRHFRQKFYSSASVHGANVRYGMEPGLTSVWHRVVAFKSIFYASQNVVSSHQAIIIKHTRPYKNAFRSSILCGGITARVVIFL